MVLETDVHWQSVGIVVAEFLKKIAKLSNTMVGIDSQLSCSGLRPALASSGTQNSLLFCRTIRVLTRPTPVIKKPGVKAGFFNDGGEGGIRTLDRGLAYTPLAGERLQPLGHLTGIFSMSSF